MSTSEPAETKTPPRHRRAKWIVLVGQPLSGFEFFGPYTETEAKRVRRQFEAYYPEHHTMSTLAVELLTYRPRSGATPRKGRGETPPLS